MRSRSLAIQSLDPRLLLAADMMPADVDLNSDGQVTSADAAIIFEALSHGSSDPTLDMTGDGQVTAFDALHVINRIETAEAPAEGLAPLVSIQDAQVIEGHAGPVELRFPVTISDEPSSDVTVQVSVTNGTAEALRVERVTNQLFRPIYATSAPGLPNHLFVAEQRGDIEVIDLQTGGVQSPKFLTINGLASGNEQGLLGLAFHPQYEQNRLLYVYLTVSNRDTVVREYQANANGLTANPATARTIMRIDQPFSNHNAGWMDFGPDGYLYIASGDGGSGNDPQNNAQDITNNLLGKMLRIDVEGDDFPSDANRNYSIPAGNPFVDVTGDDEIWSYGLRNPWRNSFDRETGDLYIADVGQNVREEINVQLGDSSGGENYGWRPREGTIQTPSSVGGPKPPGAIDPIYDYLHASTSTGGYSVTGGYVYRGPIEELRGNYFFADFVNPRVWSLRFNGDDPSVHNGTNFDDFTDWTTLLRPDVGQINSISSFAEDAAGNLYIVDLGGELFRITEGADYLVPPTTVTIPAATQAAEVVVPILGDRLAELNETFTVTLSSPSEGSIDDGVAIGTIINDDAPKVKQVVVNGGDNQRSIVDTLAVTFDSPVALDESQGPAFEVRNLGQDVAANLTKTSQVIDGETVVTIQFLSGPTVDDRGAMSPSLAAGAYQLNVFGSAVNLEGVALDGDSSGDAGGDFQFVDDFYRKFGDGDGNNVVNLFDFAAFRGTYNLPSSDPAFLPHFDFNGDDSVNLFDFAAFRNTFGT